jgi:hypothetical protein
MKKLKIVKWSDQVQDRHKWKEIGEKAKTYRVVVLKKKIQVLGYGGKNELCKQFYLSSSTILTFMERQISHYVYSRKQPPFQQLNEDM